MRLLLCAFCCVFTLPQIAASGSVPSNNPQYASFHVDGLGAASVISQIANKTGIPVGLEEDVIFGEESHIEKDFAGGTIEDVARLCASLVNQGSWTITPNRSILLKSPGQASSLGDISFYYPEQTQVDRKMIWSSLETVPEINRWLDVNRCKRSELFRGHEWDHDNTMMHIAPGNMRLDALLESAAIRSKLLFWSILANSREGRCEVHISLW